MNIVESETRVDGRPVVRSPEQLRLHPAMKELGWTGVIGELDNAVRRKNQPQPEPILITTNGTILAGFGHWRLAMLEDREEINCIEYPVADEAALQFIINHHQPQRGWNAFVRIRLALTLKPSLQEVALNNMRSGGKHKGLANLPEAHHVDVRQQVADLAGVCPRNVSNAETILELAHPALVDALENGMLKINRAMQFCKLPHVKQLEEFTRYREDRAINKVIRRSLVQPRKEDISLDPSTVVEALQSREKEASGSVVVRIVRHKRTVILVGQDLLAQIKSQKELSLK